MLYIIKGNSQLKLLESPYDFFGVSAGSPKRHIIINAIIRDG